VSLFVDGVVDRSEVVVDEVLPAVAPACGIVLSVGERVLLRRLCGGAGAIFGRLRGHGRGRERKGEDRA